MEKKGGGATTLHYTGGVVRLCTKFAYTDSCSTLINVGFNWKMPRCVRCLYWGGFDTTNVEAIAPIGGGSSQPERGWKQTYEPYH